MADKDQRTEKAAEHDQAPDATVETQAGGDAESGADLQRQLEQAQQKAEENWNNFLRARAELENVRRRAERDLEQAHKYALEKFAAELLPVKDSLEMGIVAAQDDSAGVEKLREGSELTLKMLAQAMERFEVKEVNPVGERFDPTRHEAISAQPSGEHEPNTVMHVVQKGYLLNERVLRPAMVVVSKPADGGTGGQINDKA